MNEILMKKLFVIFVIAASVIGCTKESNNTLVEKRQPLKITVNCEQASTKGTYDSNTGSFSWAEGDQIGVFFSTGSKGNVPFDWSAGNEFTYSEDLDENDHYGKVVFYPYNGGANNNVSEDGTNYNGSKLYIHLKKSIEYNSNIVPLPLVANLGDETDPTTVELKQVGAGLQVTLNNVPKEANKVTLTMSGKDITGWFEYDPTELETSYLGDGQVTLQDNSEKGSSVSYTFSHSASENMKFTFPIPAVEAPTVQVDLFVDDVLIATKTSGTLDDIDRGHILPMKAFGIQDYRFYMVGAFNSWNLSTNRKQLSKVGDWQYATVKGQFKLCFNTTASDWSETYGQNGDTWRGESLVRGTSGENFGGEKVSTIYIKGATYYVVYDDDADGAATYNEMGLVGSEIGWDYDSKYALTNEDASFPHVWTITKAFVKDETFKVRGKKTGAETHDSDTWWGYYVTDSYYEGATSTGGPGDNLKITEAGTYKITLNDITGRYIIVKVG